MLKIVSIHTDLVDALRRVVDARRRARVKQYANGRFDALRSASTRRDATRSV